MTLEYLKQNWVSHEDPDLQKTMWDRILDRTLESSEVSRNSLIQMMTTFNKFDVMIQTGGFINE